MPVFNWFDFLQQHAIEYVTTGPNVSRGEIAIRCPLCADDPSHHLAISPQGKGWICRRNREHRGRSNARLIQYLLHCSREQALRLAGVNIEIPADFVERMSAMLSDQKQVVIRQEPLRLLPSFKPFCTDKPSAQPFVRHLIRERHFSRHELDDLHVMFHLYYATHGPFSGRIIFPVYFDGELMTWTGRTIDKGREPRYRALGHSEGARGAITDYLLWFDDLIRMPDTDVICLCEGPFDAMRIRMLAPSFAATCLFTSTASNAQIDLLHELLPRFRHRFLILDEGTLSIAMGLVAQLRALQIEVRLLPSSVKDPGELAHRGQLLEILGLR